MTESQLHEPEEGASHSKAAHLVSSAAHEVGVKGRQALVGSCGQQPAHHVRLAGPLRQQVRLRASVACLSSALRARRRRRAPGACGHLQPAASCPCVEMVPCSSEPACRQVMLSALLRLNGGNFVKGEHKSGQAPAAATLSLLGRPPVAAHSPVRRSIRPRQCLVSQAPAARCLPV